MRQRVVLTKRKCNYCGTEIATAEIDRQEAARHAAWLEQRARENERLADELAKQRQDQARARLFVSALGLAFLIVVCGGCGLIGILNEKNPKSVNPQSERNKHAASSSSAPTTSSGPTTRMPRQGTDKAKREPDREDRRAELRAKGPAALAVMLKEKQPQTREEAAVAIGELGAAAASAPVVKNLTDALKDESPAVRREAATALGKIGPTARNALPALLACDADPDPEARQAIRSAVVRFAPVMSNDDLPAVIAGLKSDDATVRAFRCQILGAMGPAAEGATKDVTSAIADRDAGVRAEAVVALGNIGAPAKESAPALIRAIKDPDAKVRRNAADALGKVDTGDDTVAAWLAALRDKDAEVAAVAGAALKDSGKVKKEHIPLLTDAVKNGAPEARKYAVVLLAGVGEESLDAVKAVGQAIEDDNKAVRLEAVQALGKFGAASWRATPALGKLAHDSDKDIQRAVVRSLGKIGPKAEPAVPDIIPLLQHADFHDDVIATLRKIGKGSVSGLIDALDIEKDFKRRVELIDLLGEMGPDASEAIKPLERLTGAGHLPGIRNAARDALVKIRRNK
ncbi:hypothetical protein AYO40_03125 [Planctomycetaceae bacterium SCGC AG-212-D15]|nr:hypothetical protein AYO40_03125 [Planctomycetaceae bacterium SCGC AG-212-D15]